MSTRETQYEDDERGYDRPTKTSSGATAGEEHDDSLLVFDFLKRKRPLPSPRRLDFMFYALCFVLLLVGFNDGAQGPLLPFLQDHYEIGFLSMSYFYIANFIGSFSAGMMNVFVTDRLGVGMVMTIAPLCQCTAYILASFSPPYPIFVMLFILNGIGFAWCDAHANSMGSRLPNASMRMSLLHAWYGAGATAGPFISTSFVKHVHNAFRFYLVAAGLAVVVVLALVVVYEFRTVDQIIKPEGNEVDESIPLNPTNTEDDDEGEEEVAPKLLEKKKKQGSGDKMREILRMPSVYAIVFYMFIYIGLEVSIGGWLTSFLIHERDGDENAGYATVGYWAGMTLGRVILIPVTAKLGHRFSVQVFTWICLALQISVWLIPNLPLNAIAFAFIGMFLGPIFPSAVMIISETLPLDLQLGVIALMGSIGGGGGAAMPFLVGALSDQFGIWIFPPVCIALIVVSIILWFFVPGSKKASASTEITSG